LQALIGIEKSQLTHRPLCESKSHASDSHSSEKAAIFRGALKTFDDGHRHTAPRTPSRRQHWEVV